MWQIDAVRSTSQEKIIRIFNQADKEFILCNEYQSNTQIIDFNMTSIWRLNHDITLHDNHVD